MKKYLPSEIENKWQEVWAKEKLYEPKKGSSKPKKYILDMFPYPSGDGLHVGHMKGYVATDVISRYFRYKGFNVLHPMGWDSFGLPAENYAIKTGIHPSITTQKNISSIKKQMQMIGLSYDWDREFSTTDSDYYKWTQWIFLKLFEAGLAYEEDSPINWCPKDKTGLSNEEVIDGKCERCGTPVERKKIRQWLLKITAYANRLLEDLSLLDWPQSIIDMQKNWIGKKQGINITYPIKDLNEKIEVFTTRPDTNFGATFIALAPEHPIVASLLNLKFKILNLKLEEIRKYVEHSKNKSEVERKENKEKTGVFTGLYAINQLTGKDMPIWVADFVLMEFGTGALVGVPGHDKRDFEFASKHNLEIIRVVKGSDNDESEIKKIDQVQEDEGIMINSDFLNGLDIHEATKKIMDYMEEKGHGKKVTEYHLRDWIFSRQRYWGEPIPIIHCENCGLVAVPYDQLPLKLPQVEKYEPTGTGESPLSAIPGFVNTKCPNCRKDAKRETNTMPNWAGSSWYYLRFADPKNTKDLISKDMDKYWLPVDWYVGGAAHAVLHLLYSRFWHKFLYDEGVVSSKEPFQKLSTVGLVLAADGRKMSKSLGNVVTPEKIVGEYGADTLRLYEGFMGPFENTIAWDPTSINGVCRFLTRVWEVIQKDSIEKNDPKVEVALNKLVKSVEADILEMKFNTAIASMMEFINLIFHSGLSLKAKKKFLIVLAPFAPHITEELWQMVNVIPSKEEIQNRSSIGVEDDNFQSIHLESWPEVDSKYLEEEKVIVAVQVNGKLRDTIEIQNSNVKSQKYVEELALKSPKVNKFLYGKEPKKIIYVPGKILNIVV